MNEKLKTIEKVYTSSLKNLKTNGVKVKSKKGITLIALVITIIILLILAGISISALTQTGLFGKTKEAKEEWNKAEENENFQLSLFDKAIESIHSTRNNSSSESTVLSDFEPSITDYGKYIDIYSNANSKDISQIYGYIFLINGTVVKMDTETEYLYIKILKKTRIIISKLLLLIKMEISKKVI